MPPGNKIAVVLLMENQRAEQQISKLLFERKITLRESYILIRRLAMRRRNQELVQKKNKQSMSSTKWF